MKKSAQIANMPENALPEQGLVKIILREMVVDVRIGLHAHEQAGGRRQRIFVNIELFATLGDYLQAPTRETIIDYGHLYDAVNAWAERPHTLLIETYLQELVGVCFALPQVEACRVSVLKPDICPDVREVGVEVFMHRTEYEQMGRADA